MGVSLISIKINQQMKTSANQPTIKKIKPINFLFYRTETTVNQLDQFFWVAQELFQEAVQHKLHITGPIHWHYAGFMGDPNTPFTLEIALPVSEVIYEYDGKFHFKRTEEFSCVSIVHEGNWMEIPQSYQKLMSFAETNQLKPVAFNRELYINADFKNPEANITEVQLGVA